MQTAIAVYLLECPLLATYFTGFVVVEADMPLAVLALSAAILVAEARTKRRRQYSRPLVSYCHGHISSPLKTHLFRKSVPDHFLDN